MTNFADGRIEAVLDRLDRLASAGAVADYDVTVWGRAISADHPAAETDTGRRLLERVDAIEDWVEDAGVDVDASFERQLVDRELVGDSYSRTLLPRMAMAEWRDGELASVAPHERGNGPVSIEDRLDALAADAEVSLEGSEDGPTAVAD